MGRTYSSKAVFAAAFGGNYCGGFSRSEPTEQFAQGVSRRALSDTDLDSFRLL
jgi:hypothetical protein